MGIFSAVLGYIFFMELGLMVWELVGEIFLFGQVQLFVQGGIGPTRWFVYL